MAVNCNLTVAADPRHSMGIGSTEVIVDIMIVMASFADLVENSLEVFLDVIELAYSRCRCSSLGIEEVAREVVVAIADLTTVGLKATLDFDDSQNFFGDDSTESTLVLGDMDRLAEVGFEAKGAFVVSERVGVIGIDDVFELCIIQGAATTGSIDEILGFLDVICSI